MEMAVLSLRSGLSEIESGMERAEFVAEHIRNAVRQLDGLIGRIDVEAVLDEIFSSFCIGK